jgi:hypothetical protein
MACSIGAVYGGLVGEGEVFVDAPPSEIAELVREAVHDLIAPRDTTAPTSSATPR